MKLSVKYFGLIFLCLGVNLLSAQDSNNTWLVGIGTNAVDVYPTNSAASTMLPSYETGKMLGEFFSVENHWNLVPTVSYIQVSKYIGDGLSAGIRGSVNKIDKLGNTEVDGLAYYSVDGSLKYNLNEGSKIQPFVEIGGGYTWVDAIGAGTVNGGAGLNYWFNDFFGLTLQTQYKRALETQGMTHFQHSAGVSIRFGGSDTDGDGVYDRDDACPEIAGLEAFNGCPDADGDGIEDSKDSCPNQAGSKEMNGCPDADGDGIADKDDACPNQAGSAALAGCPDADGDGIADKDDACPTEAGPASNKGCPWQDSDGDGVADKDDLCPNVVGTVANKGCPEFSTEDHQAIMDSGKSILFDTGKSNIKSETQMFLDKIILILNNYSHSKFTLDGHADSIGSQSYNQKLSEARANSVMKYMIDHGIISERVSTNGYGEERPIAPNNTYKGRRANRRVEINLLKL
ncbi:MAG: hypothetical protein RLZZ241_2363 [Bacteroidota bacterium]|jgi:outer membrane protein OmpA-like peptidoglycan-associated protein